MIEMRELGSVATLLMGTSPKGDTYNNDGVGMPLLNGPTEFGPVHPDCTLFTTAPLRHGEIGDLLFCVRGSTTGRMNWADRPYALGRGIAAIRCGVPLETRFIRYCIEARLPSLLKRTGGGTFPNLRQTDIATFPIPWPPSRHKIASLLVAYDDLIENNLQRIGILKEMAQAIYREWFVNFRFPGHEKVAMVDSPLGSIPEGWTVKGINDVCSVRYGQTLPKALMKSDGPYKVYGAANVIGSHDEFNRRDPTVICGCRGSCGVFLMTDRESFVTNNSFIFDFPEDEKLFYFRALSHRGVAEFIGGSAQPQITLESIAHLRLVVPPKVQVVAFDIAARPMFELQSNLARQNSILRSTRDLLLPKLISGNLDVSDLDIDTDWLVA